ncbi:hypothetical protein HETIRDRAFT_381493 [Heterobasidion irregulare TC 32-1]|uniref:Uncharacterized protein n=1 Tax=Heterobasidion irregulare (strain TC 32-1) TaxID=747525 RepID=W4KEE8_HETIT|nr:uncharacterized protein HETIRDRAFT_381493 [Heterobasidion irregulare TC 32-1]ETW84114.1 hypothetical protein HETIRDRAFT_381493 [Heterobasidion irregulare TC 32-1]
MSDHPEQDADGGDALPTYDDLAEKHGPNSRSFGRWRGWIEKRAAERYADVTPDEFRRRERRGWGDGSDPPPAAQPPPPIFLNEPPTSAPSASHPPLTLHTAFEPLPSPPLYPDEYLSDDAQPLVAESLAPTHLSLNQFGSRFLSHTPAPIRALLPLLGDKLLLIGHDRGLSVLDMFPREWTDYGLQQKGPGEAQAYLIWEGEGVYQMSLLEVEDTGEGTPQGVVLALVGPEVDSPKDQEPPRTLRMYNLSSLISLAKWAMSEKGARTVDLRRPSNWHPQQTPAKQHKSRASLAKGLKSLMIDPQQHPEPGTSYHNMMPSASSSTSAYNADKKLPLPPERNGSSDSWEDVQDLPLRWATDFVPLASAGSRLQNTSVLSYDLWRDSQHFRGAALLAVSTKSNILLYESPKGQRAFRFVKVSGTIDFYTPSLPRSITFVQQNVQDTMSRSPSDATSSRRSSSSSNFGSQRHASMMVKNVVHGNHLSLFVVFDKKAGLIRLADSAVGEVDLHDDGHFSRDTLSPVAASGSLSNRRSRASYDGFGFTKESKGLWAPPAKCDLPLAVGRRELSQTVYILTRGKQSHIVPSPLPAHVAAQPPLLVLTWQSHPTHVAPRVVRARAPGARPYLQLVAFGEDGLEAQEVSLAFLADAKQKGRAEEPVRCQTAFGGDTGFLCGGGHWHRPYDAPLSRSYSTRSAASTASFDSLDTEELMARMHAEEGVYGWQDRGGDDWRIFWVGGPSGMDRDTN